MKYLELIRLVLSLLPVIIDAIKAIEAAIPGEGKGEQKLAAFRAILEQASQAVTGGLDIFTQVWPALQSTIGVLVATFNAVGQFRKS